MKERLVLGMINYVTEAEHSYEQASFLQKTSLTELMLYEYKEAEVSPNFMIKATVLIDYFNTNEKDKQIIRHDWETIVAKIREGKAEELSESLTDYLGAVTKGADRVSNMREQPYSTVKAQKRAYSLKQSYMNEIVKRIMNGTFDEHLERYKMEKNKKGRLPIRESLVTAAELKEESLETVLMKRVQPYIGKSKAELGKKFNIIIPKENDKASSRLLAERMLGVHGKIEKTDEFTKADIAVKILTVKSKNKKETTQNFKIGGYFDPGTIIDQSFESSFMYDYLKSKRFLLVVYEQLSKNKTIFKGLKFWHLPLDVLEKNGRIVFNKTQKVFREGVELTYKENKKPFKNGRCFQIGNNLPAPSEDKVFHVRPSTDYASYVKSSYSFKLPAKSKWTNRPNDHRGKWVGDVPANRDMLTDLYMTKQAFWINSSYMYQQIAELFED
jgi:DNA mismatch repair protein MutH